MLGRTQFITYACVLIYPLNLRIYSELYLQFKLVPRSKHIPSQLYKPVS
jgi:hypothetical protein